MKYIVKFQKINAYLAIGGIAEDEAGAERFQTMDEAECEAKSYISDVCESWGEEEADRIGDYTIIESADRPYFVSFCSDNKGGKPKRFDNIDHAKKYAEKLIRDFVRDASCAEFDKAIKNHGAVIIDQGDYDEDDFETVETHCFAYKYFVISEGREGEDIETLSVDGEFEKFGSGPGEKAFDTRREANMAKEEAEERCPNANADFKVIEERF